jgi:hypothetical protein
LFVDVHFNLLRSVHLQRADRKNINKIIAIEFLSTAIRFRLGD